MLTNWKGTSKVEKDIAGFQVHVNERIFLDIYAANRNVSTTIRHI